MEYQQNLFNFIPIIFKFLSNEITKKAEQNVTPSPLNFYLSTLSIAHKCVHMQAHVYHKSFRKQVIGMVALAYNPSYLGGSFRRMVNLRSAWTT
jgi:hypothetical protein